MVQRQPGQIAQAADGLQAQAQAVELLAVEFHLTVSPGQGALEALQLQQFQLFPVHGLDFRLAHVAYPPLGVLTQRRYRRKGASVGQPHSSA